MSTVVNITVEDIAERIADGYGAVSLESASSVGGSYAVVDTAALVAATYHYELEDAAGTLNTWYRYRFTATGGGAPQSDYSNPTQLPGITRLKLRQHTMQNYELGAVLLAAAGGSATVIPTADAEFKSSAYDADFGVSSRLNVTTGVRAGQSSIVADSDPTLGNFTVNPALTGALAAGDEFEWLWLGSPAQWNRAENRAMDRYWYLERVPIVGVDSQREYSLSFLPWLTDKEKVYGLWHYPYPSDAGELQDEPWSGGGRWYQVRADGPDLTLSISPAIATTKTLYLEAGRQMPKLYTDASVLPPSAKLDFAAALVYDELLAGFLRPQSGANLDRDRWRQARLEHTAGELGKLLAENRLRPRMMPPMLPHPPVVPLPFVAR